MAWFFLYASPCCSSDGEKTLQERLQVLGQVHQSSFGSAVDAQAGWFVVQLAVTTVTEVREQLGEWSSQVTFIAPLNRPEHGQAIARQLSLF